MKRITFCILAVLLVTTVLSFAQGPQAAPTPGPEVKKLDYFVGTWKAESELKPGPMGPGGKFTETTHTEWMPGHFFIVQHTDATVAGMGKMVEVAYLGYDPLGKSYTYDSFNSMGEADHAKGNVENDTWTWASSVPGPTGQNMKGRFVLTVTSPTAYSFKFEVAPESGGDYTTVLEGKATKVTAAKTAKAATKK